MVVVRIHKNFGEDIAGQVCRVENLAEVGTGETKGSVVCVMVGKGKDCRSLGQGRAVGIALAVVEDDTWKEVADGG